MSYLIQHVEESVSWLKSQGVPDIDTAIVLGTGLNHLEAILDDSKIFDYTAIPHFPTSTVIGHNGRMIIGTYNERTIVMMSGRFHFYEGYSMDEVTYYIHVLKALGVQQIVITNASGGINPELQEGEIVLVKDHINLFPYNPLRGYFNEDLGPRFPDLTRAYDKPLRSMIKNIKPDIKEVIYLGWQGPSLETKAEYRMAQIIGADIVGMSSVPEVIVARYRSIKVLLLSIVSNVVDFDSDEESNIDHIIEVMHQSGNELASIVTKLLDTFTIDQSNQ